MRSYDILADYGLKDEDADRISVNSRCVIAVYRYANHVTFSRQAQGNALPFDVNKNIELRRSPLIIVNDISTASVSSSKTSYIGSLQLMLKPGMDYLNEIFPGDIILCWMVQTEEKAQSLMDRLEKGEPCNKFRDGLKFYGKVQNIRKRFTILGQTGLRSLNFSVSATSFSEFDCSIYFEPYLQIKQVGMMSDWLQGYGLKLNQIIAQNGQGITVNKIMPELLKVFFGSGVPKNRGITSGPNITSGADNPYSFVVPEAVAKVFGVKSGTKPDGLVAFTDLLEFVHGIQKYSGEKVFSVSTPEIQRQNASFWGQIFHPSENPFILPGEREYFTGTEQLGTFVPSVPAMTGKTAWALLQQYLNPTVNEAYTTLRVNAFGDVHPTLVVRQLPFSTGLLDSKFTLKLPESPKKKKESSFFEKIEQTISKEPWLEIGDIERVPPTVKPEIRTVEATYFTELPRWRIHPIFLKNFEIGRTDALRFNFIHVTGETGAKDGINRTGAFVRDQPVRDDMDIARSGLRPYMRTVPCAPGDLARRGPGLWMYLLSDFLMGQQLTLSGVLESEGIQAPIAIGDNIEFDGVLFHIEAIQHTFSQDPQGLRRFTTSFNLSHGTERLPASTDSQIYVNLPPTNETGEQDPPVSITKDD